MKKGAGLASFAAVTALIGAQALFVAAYVGREHTIYFWDHAMYFDMARRSWFLFAHNFAAGWAVFRKALAENYNLVFALPSYAGFGLFGPSRRVFIVVNFFFFFLPYELAVAFFFRRAFALSWATALIAGLLGCALVPPLWLPLLEGYPDVGAAACLVFAAALGLKGPGRSGIAGALSIGLVLGLAVLLRRHFVYPVLALLITLAGFALWDISRARAGRRRRLGRAFVYFAACGAGFAGLLAAAAPDFLQTALTTDYRQLYLSYQRPPLVFLRFAAAGFGVGLLLIAATGLALFARTGKDHGRPAALVAIYVFLWLVIWCGGPDQMGHHYILHALPFFAVTGIAGWFVFLARQTKAKKYAGGCLLALFLFANSAWALWFSPDGVWPNDNGAPGLLSAPRPPVVRADYEEWVRLAAYLRRTTGPADRIMVVGSSFVFNLDLLHSVYMDILGAPGMTARFPKAPEIDHEEPAPLDVFAASNVYLVPTPAQYHLDPAGQRVVTAAANRFPPPPARAALFQADADVFHLADGVTVKVWRRKPWTPAVLHETLDDIRRDAPHDAHFDQDWVAVGLPLAAQIHTDGGNLTSAAALFDSGHRKLKLFFDYPLKPGAYRLGFFIASDCADPRFDLDLAAGDGHGETVKNFAPVLVPGALFQPFTVPASPAEDHFLRLDLSLVAATLCRAQLGDLRVEKMP